MVLHSCTGATEEQTCSPRKNCSLLAVIKNQLTLDSVGDLACIGDLMARSLPKRDHSHTHRT
jgi:hypothetical protein